MNKEWFIGIDVAGNGICFQIENKKGAKLSYGSACKSREGYEGFLAACSEQGVRWKRTLVVIEATGRHHLPWCERLIELGAHVHALNPLLSKRLYSTGNAIRDNKDDRIDAETLAHIGRIHGRDLERFAYTSQSDRLALQTLVSARRAIRHQCTNLLKGAGDMLALVFPECAKLNLKLTQAGFRRLLLRAPTAPRIAALPEAELAQFLGQQKGSELHRIANRCFTPEGMANATAEALVAMINAIEELHAQLSDLEHRIETRLKHHAPDSTRETERLLRSIPGIGQKSAAVIAAFLPEDIHLWGTKKKIAAKLQAYFGCDPRRRESGTMKGKVKISKRGIEIVRTTLYQLSFCCINHDPTMMAYYRCLRDRGKHHKQAIIDLMRKNIRRIVAVLVDRKEFEQRHENAA